MQAKLNTSTPLIVLMIVLSAAIAAYAFLFQAGAAGDSTFHLRFAGMPLAAAAHVLGSGVALLIGGFQFLPGLRARRPRLHRATGRVYLIAVLIGGLGGATLALSADGGLVARVGFATLAVVWLISGWQAFRAIRRGDIASHRRWMMRNFALTFAAVTLRIYLGLGQAAGIPFDELYRLVAWLCWVPNLLVAEWWLLARAPQPLRVANG